MSGPRTWLVAFDFSDLAKAALEHGRTLLAALGPGRLYVVYVHAPASDGAGIDIASVGPEFGKHEDIVMREADQQLHAYLSELPPVPGGPLVYEHQVVSGRPADKVVAIADQLGADQIVLASHGRRGLERFFLGSVAERVLRLAHCAVLVVKYTPPPLPPH